jgi:hypothetical protein
MNASHTPAPNVQHALQTGRNALSTVGEASRRRLLVAGLAVVALSLATVASLAIAATIPGAFAFLLVVTLVVASVVFVPNRRPLADVKYRSASARASVAGYY